MSIEHKKYIGKEETQNLYVHVNYALPSFTEECGRYKEEPLQLPHQLINHHQNYHPPPTTFQFHRLLLCYPAYKLGEKTANSMRTYAQQHTDVQNNYQTLDVIHDLTGILSQSFNLELVSM